MISQSVQCERPALGDMNNNYLLMDAQGEMESDT